MEENTSETEQIVRGVVKRVTFRNPQNGYSVLQLAIADQNEQVTVVGSCLEATVGAHLMVRGVYRSHPKFGRQLSATSITATEPSSPEGIARYLGSGLIKGIGPRTAKRLVEKFGDQTISIITQDPEKIAKEGGIGRKKANLLAAAMAHKRESDEIMRFLSEHSISGKLAQRIYEKYEMRTVEILKRDPYLLARQLRGVGFKTADEIASNLGFKPDSPARLKAGLYYALERAADDGHTCLPLQQLLERAQILLGLGEALDLYPYVESLVEEEFFCGLDDNYFLRHLFRAEEIVAEFIAQRCSGTHAAQISGGDLKRCLTIAEQELKVTFSDEQRFAVESATKNQLMVITGGPGCGKTTIIRAVVSVFSHMKKRVLLAAPTGRAAQRMAQVCGMPASTIHRLLKYDPINRGFLHGVNDPLMADVVVIDEASMIDIQLARDLFSAIPADATLILVGDKDQLPSVGPGRVFGDLIALDQVTTISLSHLFRRSHESSINFIAHTINSGNVPEIPAPDGVTKVDAYMLATSDAEEAAQLIEKLVADQIPRKFEIEAGDIAVLTPSNRGPLGTVTLNQRLQARLNPPGAIDSEQEVEVNGVALRIGDRVCQRVNNYQIDPAGVFNGDVGVIYSIDRKTNSLVVDMWDGRLIKYDDVDMQQLSLAYAITVHRSQGAEIPCVVLALHDSHYALLERQLIYTGITRAKKLLIVVGSRRALSIASRKTSTRRRQSMLKERVQKILNG